VLHFEFDPLDHFVVVARGILEKEGYEVWVGAQADREHNTEEEVTIVEKAIATSELVVTFGGDGTFIYGARIGTPLGIPILGINMGRLGFMTCANLQDAPEAMRAWLKGNVSVEELSVMDVVVDGVKSLAINDMALVKDVKKNMIQIEAALDGEEAGVFHADGALVSTPTGSTAYNASAWGPIVDPRANCLIFNPLLAHNLASRALVVPGDTNIELMVNEPVYVSLDGAQWFDLKAHAIVSCHMSQMKLKMVRVPGSIKFYQQLREKLTWGRPLVREGRKN
jgi:NAD+ kinase